MDKVLDTGRLILRRFTLDDLQAFYLLCSRPEIIRYAQSTPLASLEEARVMMHAAPFHDYATYGYGRFACVWKESGEVIGFSGVKYVPEIGDTELGYRFLPEFWGWDSPRRPDGPPSISRAQTWALGGWWRWFTPRTSLPPVC